MNEAVSFFGWEVMLALSLVGLIGGMISGRTWGQRAVGAGLAMAALAFGWLVAAGICYVGVNLACDLVEPSAEGKGIPASVRNEITRWTAFAVVVGIYLKVLWDEWQTPVRHQGPRLVVGRARTGRNVPGSWRV